MNWKACLQYGVPIGCVLVSAVLLLCETTAGGPDSKSRTGSLPGSVEFLSDVSGPIHNWTISLHGHAFGLTQWGKSDCNLYVGHRVATWPVPAAQVALASLLCLMLCITTAYIFSTIRQPESNRHGI
jgi:hypothetical protein